MIESFPDGISPRESQTRLLSKLNELLSDLKGKKYIVVRAPTGSGKSAICATLSNYLESRGENSYLLCSRRFLQTQYMDDFSSTYANFWGKANYICPLISASCAGCPADSLGTPKAYTRFLRTNCTNKKLGDKCPYISARKKAARAPSTLLNVEAFMSNSLAGLWSARPLLMVDEAHCLPDRAVSFFEVEAPQWCLPKELRGLRGKSATAEAKRFGSDSKEILHILEALSLRKEELAGAAEPVPKYVREGIEYLSIENMEWVYDQERRTLVPMNTSALLNKFLFSYGERVVLLSATISPNLVKEIGMNRSNSVFIDLESDWPTSNHKITYFPSLGGLNRRNLPGKSDIMAGIILSAATKHEGRGIVHAVSYSLVDILKNSILFKQHAQETRFLWHQKGQPLEELLAKYVSTPGAILVTPSLSEGFDGKGELLEWQVLAKCPYPYLGEPRVQALTKTKYGKVLFKERAISTLLQSMGRGIRSSTDTCHTYVLDKNIGSVLGSCSRKNSDHYSSTPLKFKQLWKSRETVTSI